MSVLPERTNVSIGVPRQKDAKTWKCGDINPETGLTFWKMNHYGKTEWWVSADVFLKKKQAIRDRCKARRGTLRRGDINPNSGLIFWAYSQCGIEVWGTPEQIAEWKLKTNARTRAYSARNRHKRRAYCRKYHRDNKLAILARKSAHRIKFPEKYRARSRDRSREEMKNPIKRFNLGMYNSVNNSFKRIGVERKCRTVEILGCSFSALKLHIESQFLPGMTWENRGAHRIGGPRVWSVDHLIPLSRAKNEAELLALWNYKNLRPMWGKENIQKNNRTPDEYEAAIRICA